MVWVLSKQLFCFQSIRGLFLYTRLFFHAELRILATSLWTEISVFPKSCIYGLCCVNTMAFAPGNDLSEDAMFPWYKNSSSLVPHKCCTGQRAETLGKWKALCSLSFHTAPKTDCAEWGRINRLPERLFQETSLEAPDIFETIHGKGLHCAEFEGIY